MMEILQRLDNPTEFPEEDLEDSADTITEEDDISGKLETLDIGKDDRRTLCQVLIIVSRVS
jgi:hypothetical protein